MATTVMVVGAAGRMAVALLIGIGGGGLAAYAGPTSSTSTPAVQQAQPAATPVAPEPITSHPPAVAVAVLPTDTVTVESGHSRPGFDYQMIPLPSNDPGECAARCRDDPRCHAYSFAKAGSPDPVARCHLKTRIPRASPDACCTAGVKLVTEIDIQRSGNSYRTVQLSRADYRQCARACADDRKCQSYTFIKPSAQQPQPLCQLKAALPAKLRSDCCVSGYKPEAVEIRQYTREPSGGPPPPPAAQPAEGFSKLTQPLAARRSAIWTTATIPVCWENALPQYATQRGWVQNAVARTWGANSTIQFTGWGQCASNSKGIRIRVKDEGPHTKGLGQDLDGRKDGMVLNFDFIRWRCDAGQRACIEWIAAHEFGHALGFTHEQNRSDAPAWCRDQAQASDGDIYMTPYDLGSIMNYCNPVSNNAGQLSPHDIAGLQFWYGPNQSSGMPWLPDCRQDVVLFEHNKFEGKRLLLHGSMQELGVEHFNDKVSSLCVPAGYQLVVYEHPDYTGKSAVFNGPINQLTLSNYSAGDRSGWNDVISSVRLIDLTSGAEVYDAPPGCDAGALVFEHPHFRGKRYGRYGDTARLGDEDFNDKISSVCVPRNETLTLWEHPDFKGEERVFTGPAYIQRLSGEGWNDRASAMRQQ